MTAVKTYFAHKEAHQRKEDIAATLSAALSSLGLQVTTIRQSRINLATASMRHLEDALLASSEHSKQMSLDRANGLFIELIDLPVEDKLPGEEISYDNRPLISWGYWGRFWTFGLLGDQRNSLRQVYECATRYPELAVKLFDLAFFPMTKGTDIVDACNYYEKLKSNERLPNDCAYAKLPDNQAKALLEMRIDEFVQSCKQTLRQIEAGYNFGA